MSGVLWCGGEDIDFPNGTGVTIISSGAGTNFRSGYARCAIYENQGTGFSARSLSFSGGAVTSCWLHARYYLNSGLNTPTALIGLGLNSSNQFVVGVGASSSSNSKWALLTYNGSTYTQIATETGNTLVAFTSTPIDLQITSYGASATVKLYVNGNLVINFSGSIAVSGISNLDCVALPGAGTVSSCYFSEIIVTDTLDTRAMSLVTQAPNAAGGTVGSWTGTYANINPITINDSSVISSNTVSDDFECKVNGLPSGTFSVLAVKEIARAELTAGAVPTTLKLGVYNGTTLNLDAGRTPTAAFAPYERLMLTNPITSVGWTTSDLGSIQIGFETD